ncbi:type VII secretion-associated serine protease mycosin [Rhizomonospora bruguierae]|uniref:type VII secretion-associated serine protease mycosin n=1 Tax=Rhizomonospora bruguierae TaxID=1581705 RepID=UPI001BCCFFAD|nr:type VII secretion-associated serine protease mycosin [Micromonospora sp. NBRC 107566]
MAGRTAPLTRSVRVVARALGALVVLAVVPGPPALVVPTVPAAAPVAQAVTVSLAQANAATIAPVAWPGFRARPAPECVPGGEARRPPADNWVRLRYPATGIARLSSGDGVTIAVVDSGVDRGHPLLPSRVAPGRDYLDPGGDGGRDCVGHGTAVASIIAGTRSGDGAFRGLAPASRILPVRVSEQQWTAGERTGRTVPPATFGAAIRWAVDRGARVLNLSVVLTEDHPEVRDAVAYAGSRDVVVVAAVGNQAQRGNPRPYPAAYPGVIGVGAVGPDGTRLPFSQVGPYVDLVAPGTDVPAAGPGGAPGLFAGTSYAAPFVSATAALLRSAHPGYTAAEVTRHLLATADPAAGAREAGYGAGIVNPYRALTETVTTARPRTAAPLAPATVDSVTAATLAAEQRVRQRALRFAGWATGAAFLVLLLGAAAARGSRRRWRSPSPGAAP